MPTYQYRCADCGAELEAVQSFTDPALTVCPQCQGNLRKVFSAVGVVFKGSGFYATDNRTKGASDAGKGESSGSGSPSGETTRSDKGGTAAEKKTDGAATAQKGATPAS